MGILFSFQISLRDAEKKDIEKPKENATATAGKKEKDAKEASSEKKPEEKK